MYKTYDELMDKITKTELIEVVSEALNDVMVPALEDMESRINNKIEVLQEDVITLKEDVNSLIMSMDSVERKFDAQQNRQDRHDKRISVLEQSAISAL